MADAEHQQQDVTLKEEGEPAPDVAMDTASQGLKRPAPDGELASQEEPEAKQARLDDGAAEG